MSSQPFSRPLPANRGVLFSKETKRHSKQLQAQRSSMADFSSHHSLLLKMPAALTNGHSPNLASLLFYGQNHAKEQR